MHRNLFILLLILFMFFLANPASAVLADSDPSIKDTAAVDAQNSLLQFTAGGHVLGFDKDKMFMATGSHALRVEFVNATGSGPKAEGGGDQEAGSGAKAAPPLSTVTYPELWKGITLAYDQTGGNVRSTYTVAPNANVADIRLRYNVPVKLMQGGSLRLEFETGYMSESPPVAWQVINGRKKSVQVAFLSHSEQEIGFAASDYDPSLELVIDPTFSWNTFMGSGTNDQGYGIAVDGGGNVYVTGQSSATWGSPVNGFAGNADVFAAKLNPNGTRAWNTFMGSANSDKGYGIAVDGGGNVYVTGFSNATWGSPVNGFAGMYDVFAAKLNPDGTRAWNTFMGSAASFDQGYGNGIAVDGGGNVYVTGYSSATWGSPVNGFAGGYDVFAAKLNPNGTLAWNTFMGSADTDVSHGIALDGGGNVYVTGVSIATWGSPVNGYAGGNDVFAAKLNPNGTRAWNTFMGSAADDQCYGIAVDGGGNVYVTGYSDTTWGSPVNAFAGQRDAFAAKLNPNGTRAWNTFMGSAVTDQGYGIAVDGGGNVYVTGFSYATWGSPANGFAGGSDAFAAKLNLNGTRAWNTFMGSASSDEGSGIAVDGGGNVYVTGYSAATWGSPVNGHAGGAWYAFAAKLNDVPAGITVSPTSGLTTTEAGGTATFTVVLNTQPTADVTIGISSGDTTEGTVAPESLTFTPSGAGIWSTLQTVTVTGVDDAIVDGNIAFNIVTAAATSGDTNYDTMNPADVSVTNNDNDYTISGTVTLGGSPLAGVTIGGLTGSPVTDGSGNYSATVAYNFSGSATPSLAGYTFSPATRTYTNVQANQTSQDYTATAPICTYGITPTSKSVAAAGEIGNTVDVTAGSTCAWTAAVNPSADSWIIITAGDSGTGDGSVTYNVSANAGCSSRSGTMTIAGETFTVNQEAGTCTYSIDPVSNSHGPSAGTGSVFVDASLSCCDWTAVRNAAWITIASGDSGLGSGTVEYSVATNDTCIGRSGTITIAGETFTVNQDAGFNPPLISGTPISSLNEGTTYSFIPTTTNGCGNLTFSIVNMPFWATFNTNTGELSGTDTLAGTYSDIEITVYDDNMDSDTIGPFEIVVNCIPPAISGMPSSSVDDGSAYSFAPTLVGGCGGSTFSITNKPAWANFDTYTGTLSGRATPPGNYTGIEITATDGNSNSDTIGPFDILVNCINPTISSTPASSVYAQMPYNFTPTVTGGCGALTFSVTNKPAWASFNTGTGRLTGTPDVNDVGTYSGIVITVTDANNNSDSLPTFDIEVNSPCTGTNLIWNTFMGSTASIEENGNDVAVDSDGNVYVTGRSAATWGTPINPFAGGDADAFVAKFNSDGILEWNTFLGSSVDGIVGSDTGHGIAVDANGNIYVSGVSYSTWGSPINDIPYGDHAFVAKLNRSGVLQWNTFLGSSHDIGYDIAADSSGNVYVAGWSTGSWGTPERPHSGDGNGDGFAAMLNTNGALQWNTFMGSSSEDGAHGIVADISGNVYVTGKSAASWGSPVNPYTNANDIFAAKLNSSGALQWNTFLGSSGNDVGYGIAVDSGGNVYVAGESENDWGTPIIPYAGNLDGLVAKLDNNGVLQWHTFMGLATIDFCHTITVDANDNVYAAGYNGDAFAVRLDSSGTLHWQIFMGAAGSDAGKAIAVGTSGNVYVAGNSFTSWGSPINGLVGNSDAFVAKIQDCYTPCTAPTISGTPASPVDEGTAYSFTPTVTGGCGTLTYSITNKPSWANFDTDTGELSGSATPADTYVGVEITVSDDNSDSDILGPFDIVVVGCSYSINPSSSSVPASGVIGNTVAVTAGSTCTWTASENLSWITITDGASGTGNGTVTYTVTANTGPARNGIMTIAGQTYAVSQAPAPSFYVRSATTNNSVVFTDESGEGHAITRFGDTKHVTFGTDTAIRFDGNGDYLKTPASPDWNFGTGDFTIDLWVYFTSTPDNFDGIFSTLKQSGTTGAYLMQVANGKIQWYAPGTTGWMNTGVTPVVGEWIHLAAVRSGNVLTIYVDGVDRVHQACTGLSFNSSNAGLVLGRLYTLTNGSYFSGYMDEMRVTKGYALWTGDFTPPNNPDAPDTDNDRISDEQETGTYSTDPNVADTDDDGIEDGDELNYWNTNWNTDYDGDAGTYANNLLDPDSDNDGLSDGDEINTYGSDPSTADTDSDSLNDSLEVNTYETDPVLADTDGDGMDDGDEVAYWSIHPTAGWDSDSDSDGVVNLLDPDSDNDGFTDEKEQIAATDPADPASFPVMPAGNALYLKSATTNDSIVFTDESGVGHGITPYGDTKHVTFGTDTAIQLDGNGDYLKTPASPDWDFGTGDFTIDLWVNFTSTPDNFDGIFSTYKKSGTSGGYLMQVTGGTIQWYAPGTTGWMNTGVTPVVGQWYHLAAVRSGNVLTIYVNGVDRVHQPYTGSINSSSDGLVLGKLYTLTIGYYFGGYMDEMRVTKGFALWTDNFTPPNSPE